MEPDNWETHESFAFVYDGWNMIAEVAEKNLQHSPVTTLNSYTWGLDLSGSLRGAGGLLAVTESTTTNDSTDMPSYTGTASWLL